MTEQSDEQERERLFGARRLSDTGLLTLCQTLYQLAVSVDLTLTAIVGLRLAPTMTLATFPLTLITLTGAIASALAGMLVPRFGYRRVMLTGAGCAALGGGMSTFAVVSGSFPLLCVGTSLVGLHKATGAYYRYLAADRAAPGRRSRALATVLSGGVAAAVIGPLAAAGSVNVLSKPYAASYLMVATVCTLALPLIAALSNATAAAPGSSATATAAATVRRTPTPLRTALRFGAFWDGTFALCVAGGVMTLLMAIGPLANAHAGHSMDQGAMIIQWHMIGMYAPSWCTGRMTTALGPKRTALIGTMCLVLGGAVGAQGTGMFWMMGGLALIGVGWNVLYVAGSAFTVQSYQPGTGSRIQSAVEGTSSAVAAAASLGAAAVFTHLGWSGANTAAVGVGALALCYFMRPTRRTAPPTENPPLRLPSGDGAQPLESPVA
jgi:MFS family permease